MQTGTEVVNAKLIQSVSEFINQNKAFSDSMKAFVATFDNIMKEVNLSEEEKAKLTTFLKPYREVAENNCATHLFEGLNAPTTAETYKEALNKIKTGFSDKDNIDAMFSALEKGMQEKDDFVKFMTAVASAHPDAFKPRVSSLNDRLTAAGLAMGTLKAQQEIAGEKVWYEGKPVSEKTTFANEIEKTFQQPTRISMPLVETVKNSDDNELKSIVESLTARVTEINERKRAAENAAVEKALAEMTALNPPKAPPKHKRSLSLGSMSRIFKGLNSKSSAKEIKSTISASKTATPKSSSPQVERKSASTLERSAPKTDTRKISSPHVERKASYTLERSASSVLSVNSSSSIRRKSGEDKLENQENNEPKRSPRR